MYLRPENMIVSGPFSAVWRVRRVRRFERHLSKLRIPPMMDVFTFLPELPGRFFPEYCALLPHSRKKNRFQKFAHHIIMKIPAGTAALSAAQAGLHAGVQRIKIRENVMVQVFRGDTACGHFQT
ncbi:hypothetical protein [Methanoplanus endosymbiosus]|uniref:Uncharacterized protein n=1 Tax=Methanoplanus endosymbiosus TaxID=33865 RepID=A0A9E7PMM5_9EURY|nr:hypothetical protein [Methanoplanus endosymbiosus]UUX93018.1 hypothetical protein L6E24_02505 [Methanoplanus endosymbiosus]